MKLHLAIIELYWSKIHGELNDDEKYIHYHYLVTEMFSRRNVRSCVYNSDGTNNVIEYYKEQYDKYINMQNGIWPIISTHPNVHISNFECIVSNNNYIQFHIVQPKLLKTGHAICIIKTHYIRWIQRAWRRLCSQRKEVMNQRLQSDNIIYYHAHGIWPNHCNNIPEMRGMIYRK